MLITGNIPYKTEVASVFIFNQIAEQQPRPAPRRSRSCCSTISFAVLLAVGGIRRFATRYERA